MANKYYFTWGVGYGSKILAEKNALRNAKISSVDLTGLKKLEVPKGNVVELKKQLKGKAKGIVLKKCVKGEAAVALFLGITADKIYIGKGMGRSLQKAVKKAESELKKKKIDFEGTQEIASSAEAKKGEYSCAVVALLIK
ncbi:hypothetical protein GF374_00530 [Candidatus Woesearchaeota archaeon]|nr:hypothetical protein [Candidatus Woesearchaeota archaeon]